MLDIIDSIASAILQEYRPLILLTSRVLCFVAKYINYWTLLEADK